KCNVQPRDVLVTVFKIPASDVASAGAREKSIVSHYKRYYEWEMGIDQIPSVVRPRRAYSRYR
ncbi:hypothetical protein JG687_00009642, partial [Phytophthora cactorum]